jgi:tetratricopeptide (TPR) repeat protein
MRFAAGLLLCVVAACQPQQQASLSVEQAKQITTEFKGQSFVAPPRTVADITAVLDQYKPDPAKVAANRAAADRQPPEGLSGLEAARFYYDRGMAARELGRLPQQLADFRRAAERVPSGTSETGVIRLMLQTAEFGSGNLGKAIQIAEERARSEPAGTRGINIATFAQLVSYNVARGSLEDADRWLAQTQQLYREAQTWPNTQGVRSMWQYFTGSAEAHLLLARGHPDQAETRLRAGVAAVDAGLATYSGWNVQGRNQVSRETVESIRDGAIRQHAGALRDQGRLVEAEVEGRRALTNTLRRLGRYNIQTADRLNDLARTLLDQGRFADAERLARAAIDVGVTIEARGSWNMAQAREVLSSALVAEARWAR